MNLIVSEYERIKALSWGEFFRELPAYLRAKVEVKWQTIAPGIVMCSLYVSPTKWSVWMER